MALWRSTCDGSQTTGFRISPPSPRPRGAAIICCCFSISKLDIVKLMYRFAFVKTRCA